MILSYIHIYTYAYSISKPYLSPPGSEVRSSDSVPRFNRAHLLVSPRAYGSYRSLYTLAVIAPGQFCLSLFLSTTFQIANVISERRRLVPSPLLSSPLLALTLENYCFCDIRLPE